MARERSPFRYTIEVYKLRPQEHLGTVAVRPDWEPAVEWTWFSALRHNPKLPLLFDVTEGLVEPCWDEQLGAPRVSKLKVGVSFAGQQFAADIPASYFLTRAEIASAEFVSRGQLSPGEIFQYGVCAYHVGPWAKTEDQPRTPRLAVTPATVPLDVQEGAIDDFLRRSTPCGNGSHRDRLDGGPLPVFIPLHVLTEAQELMHTAGAKETGGILIGHVHRDRGRPELFLEVTTQVPAQHAQQELTQLTFTPDTWAAVDRAIALRRRGELYLGWWHTHPVGHWDTYGKKEAERRGRARDAANGDFFSVYDVAVHRAVFPRAYSIALVLSDYGQGKGRSSVQLYGWDRGMIVPREFGVLTGASATGHSRAS